MTQSITAVSANGFAAELAELLLNTEQVQSDSAHQERDAARADVLHEAESQVKALHEAADDMRTGAWASAAMSVASSACTVVGSVEQFKADSALSKHCGAADQALATQWSAIGKGLADLTAPTKTLVGDAPAADANANAKLFETLAEKAKWVAGDASDEIEKVAKLGDKVLDLLQGINQDQNSANNALIGRI